MEDDKQTKRLSKAAIAEYQAKLDELKNVTRLEIAQQIKEARAFGDISENAEYDAAMDHQARVEYEILQLEDLLVNVEAIDEDSIDTSSVSVGGRVRVSCLADDTVEEYDIVSTSESEPFRRLVTIECLDNKHNKELGYSKGQKVEISYPPKLSNESPLGRSILGMKEGARVQVAAPHGLIEYRVDRIIKIPDTPQGKILFDQIEY